MSKKTTQVTKTDQELTLISDESIERFKSIESKIVELQKLNANEISALAIAGAKANVISELRKALPDELVKKIKDNLENNRLGFKTDKEDGGYPIKAIRDCLIESAVNGFLWHGNEFNIIGGNAYFTKEGFTGLLKRHKDFSDIKIEFGLPKHETQNKRAVIDVSATWKYKDKPFSLKDTLSVKIAVKNGINYTTDDAVIGKAERKIKARIWEESTGMYLPEADVSEHSSDIMENKIKNAEEVKAEVQDEIDKNANTEQLDFVDDPGNSELFDRKRSF